VASSCVASAGTRENELGDVGGKQEVAPCCWRPTSVNYKNTTGENLQITLKITIKVENL
jgi:hypothetical protein